MRFPLIVVAVLVLAGFQSHENAGGCGAADPGIDSLHKHWDAAMSRADVDSLLKLLDRDFVVVPATGVPVSRPQELRTMLWSTFGRTRVSSSFQCESRWREGDLVVERGWQALTFKPLDGGARRTRGQRVMLTLKRGVDGYWRIAWRMFDAGR